jgi:hypothetical protein
MKEDGSFAKMTAQKKIENGTLRFLSNLFHQHERKQLSFRAQLPPPLSPVAFFHVFFSYA